MSANPDLFDAADLYGEGTPPAPPPPPQPAEPPPNYAKAEDVANLQQMILQQHTILQSLANQRAAPPQQPEQQQTPRLPAIDFQRLQTDEGPQYLAQTVDQIAEQRLKAQVEPLQQTIQAMGQVLVALFNRQEMLSQNPDLPKVLAENPQLVEGLKADGITDPRVQYNIITKYAKKGSQPPAQNVARIPSRNIERPGGAGSSAPEPPAPTFEAAVYDVMRSGSGGGGGSSLV